LSDTKMISPLLDGFQLGAPIFEHNGVTCCPAIKENSNKKYIVKIISVPASQAQLDALLLAGAYKDPADAMEYFRRKGESILEEAEHLKTLSKLEGFLPYDGWQMEPITRRRLGYEIYLVGSYKRSLAKYMAKNAFTHLEAINLGLDLCSALSVCRQSGYLYVDLKPSNIYVSENKQFRIGDLGFLNLDSLRYASLPERYHSPYSPPELLDPMTPMNLSVDTYSVGMILYQLYNDGHLPFTGIAPQQPLSSPVHADYELAEIIMKAIDPDPEKRWMDPKDLGKAIASYMQRNRVNNIPITPFIPLDVTPEVIPSEPAEKKPRKKKKVKQPVPEPVVAAPEKTELPAADISDSSESEPAKSDTVSAPTEVTAIPLQDSDVTSCEMQVTSDSAVENVPEMIPSEEAESEEVAAAAEKSDPVTESEYTNQNLSDDVIQIITKADDLIVHEIPDDTIFPSEETIDPFAFVFEDSDDAVDGFQEDPDIETEDSDTLPKNRKKTKHFADTSGRKKIKKFFTGLFLILILCAAAIGGYWYYENVFLQPIDFLTVTGTQNQIMVLIDTSIDESVLTVSCTDTTGTQHTQSVKGGKAVFDHLKPSTQYTVEVQIAGFHKLTGMSSRIFTTDAPTQIVSLETMAGSEDGSVIISFTVDGDEPDFWNIRYSAEGEDEQRETITNHSTMITGLTVGKVYTFTLDGGKNFDLGGKTSLQYIASKLILAENLNAVSDNGSDVTIHWDTPGDVVIENWNVRIYDRYGFEEQATVTDTKALFTGLDSASDYTVEVTASGMTQPQRIKLTADPILITDFQIDESANTKLKLSWKFTGTAPKNGWVLNYTVDGSGNQVMECKDASASIEPLLPGAVYHFTLQSADERTVYNNSKLHATADAEKFADNGMILEDLSIDLLKTPEDANWSYETLKDPVYTDSFAAGDSASLILKSASTFYLPGYETKVLYVFRNAYGNVLPELVSEQTYYWKNIWIDGDSRIGELNIPALPDTPGEYVIELYFNGKAVAQMSIKITE